MSEMPLYILLLYGLGSFIIGGIAMARFGKKMILRQHEDMEMQISNETKIKMFSLIADDLKKKGALKSDEEEILKELQKEWEK